MLIPVILSGGAGTRLWPVSREGHPKPFMKLHDGETLLQKTYRRAAAVADGGELLTVTNRDYYFMSKDELARSLPASVINSSFLLEPCGRNTAPAVLLAALYAYHRLGAEATLLVLAADHLIQDQAAFEQAVHQAAELAGQGHLVTFGIPPLAPETGFGYIECGEPLGAGLRVKRFVEKPDRETAEGYLASGTFLWNSGMFCLRADILLREFELLCPELFAAANACWQATLATGEQGRMLEFSAESFAALEDISIDYAVMEKSERIAVVPAAMGWSDIGSWSAVQALFPADAHNNRATGDAILVDSHNVFVQSEDRLVATVGVDNLMIVDTPDALLVAHPDQAQAVKQVVAQLKARNHASYRLHRTVARPWGTYTVLEEGPRFKIKRIEVKPGASLSLQMHHHRSEHWIVVRGMAKVTNGEQETFISANESTYIPAGHRHRLENPGLLTLVMIEVQSGEYLGEDDIVRFEDRYGRLA